MCIALMILGKIKRNRTKQNETENQSDKFKSEAWIGKRQTKLQKFSFVKLCYFRIIEQKEINTSCLFHFTFKVTEFRRLTELTASK